MFPLAAWLCTHFLNVTFSREIIGHPWQAGGELSTGWPTEASSLNPTYRFSSSGMVEMQWPVFLLGLLPCSCPSYFIFYLKEIHLLWISLQWKCKGRGILELEQGQAVKLVGFTALCDPQISCCHLFYFNSCIPRDMVWQLCILFYFTVI